MSFETIKLSGPPTADDLARIDEKADGRRVIRADEKVYLIMPEGRPRRFPCGACKRTVPVGAVCTCQEKPKLAASEHVTEQTDPKVRARLGLGSRA